jgi:hypothetical protein
MMLARSGRMIRVIAVDTRAASVLLFLSVRSVSRFEVNMAENPENHRVYAAAGAKSTRKRD